MSSAQQPFVSVCAWCQRIKNVTLAAQAGITHGRCELCREEQERFAGSDDLKVQLHRTRTDIEITPAGYTALGCKPGPYDRVKAYAETKRSAPEELPADLHDDVRILARRAVEHRCQLSPYMLSLLRLLPENR